MPVLKLKVFLDDNFDENDVKIFVELKFHCVYHPCADFARCHLSDRNLWRGIQEADGQRGQLRVPRVRSVNGGRSCVK